MIFQIFLLCIFLIGPSLFVWILSKIPFKKNLFPFNFLTWIVLMGISPIKEANNLYQLLVLLFPLLMALDVVAFHNNKFFSILKKWSPLAGALFSFCMGVTLVGIGFFEFMKEAGLIFAIILPLNLISVFILYFLNRKYSLLQSAR